MRCPFVIDSGSYWRHKLQEKNKGHPPLSTCLSIHIHLLVPNTENCCLSSMPVQRFYFCWEGGWWGIILQWQKVISYVTNAFYVKHWRKNKRKMKWEYSVGKLPFLHLLLVWDNFSFPISYGFFGSGRGCVSGVG